ncbi:hypothetical protein QQ045_020258 [Rhodiola kirilowii]
MGGPRLLLSMAFASLLLSVHSSPPTIIYSSKFIHRFSSEYLAHTGIPPERTTRTLDYYQMLVRIDLQKQNMKLATQFQLLYPSHGSNTVSFGNDFGWLHYTWIDIGTPSVSFLVALDVGSDLLWVPCDCVQCAPLASGYYGVLDRNLNQYMPSSSSTSRALTCDHELCDSKSSCGSSKQTCPYTVNYISENTSTSGVLIEDILHLSSSNGDGSMSSVRKRVIIGCGRKQSGGYLDGVAPDGLLGLGFGQKSLPSLLAKEKLVRNSFSMCFGDDDTGSILFGDQGLAGQQYTPFVPSDGKFKTYIVVVDATCIGNSCLKETNFEAMIDSGTSFTFLPNAIYESVVQEFDKLVEEKQSSYEGSPWKYCYEYSSHELPKIPSVKLIFASNSSFVVHTPILLIYDDSQVVSGFCLAIQPLEGDVGIIGQNFMTGYRMVFDRENLKLGWSRSNCHDISDNKTLPFAPSANGRTAPPNPLPTNEQQNVPPKRPIVVPAVAGKTPSKSSADSNITFRSLLFFFLLVPVYGFLTVTAA